MKTLFVMRHAKSALGSPDQTDLDRPLLEKGKKRTKHIIDYLLKKQVKVDLLLTSPAVRSNETAIIMAHGLNIPESNMREEKLIYSADSDRLFDLFYDLPSSVNKLMIIGHNPAVTNFVNIYLDEKIDALPTSGVVCLSFETDDWTQIASCMVRVDFIVFPKMLG